jgi:MATE family, multidrug efflux pump
MPIRWVSRKNNNRTRNLMSVEEAAASPLDLAEAAPPAPRVATARNKAEETRAALLNGPILPTLLKLALPTVTVLVAQTAVNIAEAYYVGFLGTDALAGAALVFPIFMLMTMMSNGGFGSGVASSVARAIGAGRRDDANAALFHAMVLAVILGALFTLGATFGGPARSARRSPIPTICSLPRSRSGSSTCSRPHCEVPAMSACLHW